MFNLGVLFDDLGRTGAALEAYQAAIEEDPDLADCHYNLARLYESLGKPQHAIRHLGQYRRLMLTLTLDSRHAPSASIVTPRQPVMAIWVGTSGYNYPEWRGSFYPEKLPTTKMLPYYAERLSTVEINYTFYRIPNEKILDGWSAATPERFSLTLKAPKRITHDARLKDCAERLKFFTGHRVDARTEAGRAAVPAAAELAPGRRGARCVSRDVSARRVRGFRVPSRLLAG